MKILVTYGWVRSSYAVLRNLTKHGHEVFIADSTRIGMCQWSRKKSGFDKYTSHYVSEEQFVSDVISICKKRKIELIIPSHNETAVLAKSKERFAGVAEIICPSEHHCDLFNNKRLSYEFARSVGLNVPSTINYGNISELRSKIKNSTKKYYVKLLTGNSSKGVFACDGEFETINKVKELIKSYNLSSQRLPQVEEAVVGDGWGCSVFYSQGKLVSSFTHRRLVEKKSEGGTSTLREAAEYGVILDKTKKLFDEAKYNGFAMAEYKVCEETGKYWFIEVNPRLWGSLALAIEAGVEFPKLAVDATQSGVGEAQDGGVKVGWRNTWLLGTFFVFFGGVLTLRAGALQEFRSALRADAFDDFYLDDPLVFFAEITSYLYSALKTRSMNPEIEGMLG